MYAHNFKDLTGQRFTRLIVIERTNNNKENRSMWKCKCDCGNIVVVMGKLLKNGGVKSCGCFKRSNFDGKRYDPTTHGGYRTRLYKIWDKINQRCSNVNNVYYKNYGGRGITVCGEWQKSFVAFRDWALSHGYKDNLTIDRKNNNDNYEPDNCRWATKKEQANNRRCNRMITYLGKTKTMSEWAEEYNIFYTTLSNRIHRHKWSIEKALTTPVKNNKRPA